ncbi:MAG: Na(+)-translocating NADH-quinone reductase subunit C [Proteobacteria bacterium]|nr:Na(+)-translocating NADH-quinone reductase subunit C [Pseudomonadota bacterium]
MQHSARYVVIFAAAVCVVCSVFVSAAAVSLRERQEANKLLDRQKKVLTVAGMMRDGESLPAAEVARIFETSVRTHVVRLAGGRMLPDVDPELYDPRQAAADPDRSHPAPSNRAGILRVADQQLVYHVVEDGDVSAVILPIEGKGLWSTLYGYLALAPDTRTVRGITFYEHGETPGLGGEVDNPGWKAKWPGRLAFDEDWTPRIGVKKGVAGPPESDPYRVDGLSGATITSRGVTQLLEFWLGEAGFGPYLTEFRSGGGRG